MGTMTNTRQAQLYEIDPPLAGPVAFNLDGGEQSDDRTTAQIAFRKLAGGLELCLAINSDGSAYTTVRTDRIVLDKNQLVHLIQCLQVCL